MTDYDPDVLLIQERKIQSFLMNHMINGVHVNVIDMLHEIDKIRTDVKRGCTINMSGGPLVKWKYNKDLPHWLQHDAVIPSKTGRNQQRNEMDIYDVFRDIDMMLKKLVVLMEKVRDDTFIDRDIGGRLDVY